MTDIRTKDVQKIFDSAFCNVTRKIAKLDLQKVYGEKILSEKEIMSHGYREVIRTHGFLETMVVCQFSESLYQYITDSMNGGKSPSQQDVHLYLNEYINIACGFAISQVNNITGKMSRLSVPRFYQVGEKMQEKIIANQKKILSYHSAAGMLHIVILYFVQSEKEEEE